MAIYTKSNKKVKSIFVNVNGEKKNIISAWVNRDGVPAKVFGLNNGKDDPYEIAPSEACNDWQYTLDNTNKIITLYNYLSNSINAIVYANYIVDGEVYKTKLYSNNSYTSSPYYMFKDRKQLQYVEFSKNIDTSNMTGTVQMFSNCQKLESIDFGGFTTNNITNMSYMFYNCIALKNLDVSGFDTSNVTNMGNMFCSCWELPHLDVSGFDTGKVTDTSGMFLKCKTLTELDVSGFDTSKVTSMQSMFDGCEALTAIDVSGFDTSNVTRMTNMFNDCYALTAIDVSGFDTSKVTDMASMFQDCSSLSILDLRSFDTSKNSANSMQYMFSGCSKLEAIYATEGKWIVPSSSKNVFLGCPAGDVTYK